MRLQVTVAILLAASLAGCSFVPRANAPQKELSDHYSAAGPAPAETMADGVTQHFALGARPTPDWRKTYQCEALNALVEEGLAHSPSLAAAQAILKATHEALREQIGNNLYSSIDLGFAPSRQRALSIPTLPQETFLYNVFALEAQASYKFDFFGAYIYTRTARWRSRSRSRRSSSMPRAAHWRRTL